MPVTSRTQVGIVGAGPAGLLLSHLLALAGVDSVVVENRTRAYCEARQRAGLLEAGTVELLRSVGLGKRLDAEGIEHDGIYLQFLGERHHLNFRELTDGRWVTVYAQTEIVKDLIAARLADGGAIEFSCSDVSVSGVTSDRPVLSYTDSSGVAHEVSCDVIAGCDGFHGVCRPLIPDLQVSERTYPYAWLGILANAAPSTDELIYSRHADGFALYSMRSPEVSRLYLQVAPDEPLDRWPDDRIWAELQKRFALERLVGVRGTDHRQVGHRDAQLRRRADAARPAVPGRGRGAHRAADRRQGPQPRAVRRGGAGERAPRAAERGVVGAGRRLLRHLPARVWRCTHFSWWMTSMLHVTPGSDAFESQLQLAQLSYVTSSRAAALSLAENYSGYEPVRFEL